MADAHQASLNKFRAKLLEHTTLEAKIKDGTLDDVFVFFDKRGLLVAITIMFVVECLCVSILRLPSGMLYYTVYFT